MHRFIMIRHKNHPTLGAEGFQRAAKELNYRLMKLSGEMKSLSSKNARTCTYIRRKEILDNSTGNVQGNEQVYKRTPIFD